VARDRKRAKQRRERASQNAARSARGAQAVSPTQGPVRADVPGALDHASSDVDEFDAALIRGAGGVAADDPVAEAEPAPAGPDEEAFDETEDALQEDGATLPGGGGGRGDGAGRDGGGGPGGGRGGERPSGAPLRGGNRAVGFLRASWAELQRVQWPDRRQVTQATAVVLGFVAIAGAYLGLADFVAKEIVEAIL
jgi:preprotein translocase subunit SecE